MNPRAVNILLIATLAAVIVLMATNSSITGFMAKDSDKNYFLYFTNIPTNNEVSKIGEYANVRFQYDDFPVISISASQENLNKILENKNIEKYEKVESAKIALFYLVSEQRQDEQIIPSQLSEINADKAWEKSEGKDVKVAVLDTGISRKHPDLEQNIALCVSETGSNCEDRNGHGTHTAGIIAAGFNQIGIVGVAPRAKLYVVQVCDSEGICDADAIAKGIEDARKSKVQIIDIGFASKNDLGEIVKKEISKAYSENVIVVAPSGENGGFVYFPAAYETVIAARAEKPWANFGEEIDATAPGEALSTYNSFNYATIAGTSVSAAYTSGTIALMLAVNPELTFTHIKDILKNTASDNINSQGAVLASG